VTEHEPFIDYLLKISVKVYSFRRGPFVNRQIYLARNDIGQQEAPGQHKKKSLVEHRTKIRLSRCLLTIDNMPQTAHYFIVLANSFVRRK